MLFQTRLARTSLLLLTVGCCASAAAAQQTYVDTSVSRGPSHQRVIVTATPGQEDAVLGTLQRHGAPVTSRHPSINGFAATISGTDIADLVRNGAATIMPDAVVHGSGAPAVVKNATALDPTAAQPMTVSTLRLSLGLNAGASRNQTSGINGTGITVAVIDSGIAPSADFTDANGLSRIVTWADYTKTPAQPHVCSGAQAASCAYDDFGHGTHVAGLIASSGALSGYMFQGIAPNAQLAVFKVLSADGSSSVSTVMAAIERAVASGVQVINLSLGHTITAPAQFDPLVQAVEYASRHGVTVVVAAGNDGPGYSSIDSPGNAPSAITVGAVDGKATVSRGDDYVPSFSSRGPTWYDGYAKPDVVAPGVNLFSDASGGSTLVLSQNPAYPQETVGTANLLDLSGTSMATAVAAGVIALELDANPGLTPGAAKAMLEYTSSALDNVGALTQGVGQINAAGAIVLASAVNTNAPVNTWWLQAGVQESSTIGTQTIAWDKNIIWGSNVLGGRFIYYNDAMWDDNIVWGTGVAQGGQLLASLPRVKGSRNGIVLGTNIDVLGPSLVWGAPGLRSKWSNRRCGCVWQSDSLDNIVWGTDDGDNIIWGTNLAPNRVIGERVGTSIKWLRGKVDQGVFTKLDADNIVWGTDDGDNIIWGTWAGNAIVWGKTDDDNIVWGTSTADDNIIWGTSVASNIAKGVASTLPKMPKATDVSDNIIWGTDLAGDNIVWGTDDLGDNIIWGTDDLDNIIWGTSDDNVLWGTDDGDNVIWGTSVGAGLGR